MPPSGYRAGVRAIHGRGKAEEGACQSDRDAGKLYDPDGVGARQPVNTSIAVRTISILSTSQRWVAGRSDLPTRTFPYALAP